MRYPAVRDPAALQQDRRVSDEAVRRFEGVSVPEPDYANDDGSIDPQLERVLKAYDDGSASLRDVVAVLAHARLMTPLVAVLDEAESSPDGLRQEKSSHLASVSLVPSGRTHAMDMAGAHPTSYTVATVLDIMSLTLDHRPRRGRNETTYPIHALAASVLSSCPRLA